MSIISENTNLHLRVISRLQIEDGPQWSTNTPVTGTPDGSQFCVGFQCNNMPTDGTISVNIPGPNAENSVDFTGKIPTPNSGMMWGVIWSPNEESTINITWTSGGTIPPSGANIQAVVAYPTSM